ncbi:hypothetical protein IFM89_012681 [Coptis chinensis]|uniref:Uncharacterized protein n=1 Tax=Coptis chinensis TaxID=261450 RepID=A0A835H5K2_9MAGN|nr:hypothetical protein IFM89_012681 [Coptis chinensis]
MGGRVVAIGRMLGDRAEVPENAYRIVVDKILEFHAELFGARGKTFSDIDVGSTEVTSKQCEDPASILPELHWGGIASIDTHSNYVLEQSNNSVQVGASTKDAPQVESSVAKRGDILIDINDRFPRDFLSNIFSKERLTEESSSIIPLYSDGTGLSINIGHSFRS